MCWTYALVMAHVWAGLIYFEAATMKCVAAFIVMAVWAGIALAKLIMRIDKGLGL